MGRSKSELFAAETSCPVPLPGIEWNHMHAASLPELLDLLPAWRVIVLAPDLLHTHRMHAWEAACTLCSAAAGRPPQCMRERCACMLWPTAMDL